MPQRITTYQPLSIHLERGQGVWLYDKQGKAYLDTYSGIAVNGLGHAHPEVLKTIQFQAEKAIHLSNGLFIEQQLQLADRLAEVSHLEQAFFSNSGAEANEAALKLARLYGHAKGIDSPSVIVMEKAFHGRTLATLSASGSPKIQAGFEPLVSGFVRVPFNDMPSIVDIASTRSDVVAVMLETIQGEGGIRSADERYLQALAAFCREKDWLLIVDEVQTGNARTGDYFSYLSLGFMPDIVTTAKGLANGIPIGACLIGERAKNLFQPGNHGSTFGGNPLACAVALTVMDVIERDHLCQRAQQLGHDLTLMLQQTFADVPEVKAIRGKGLMLGVELDRPANALKEIAAQHGLLINVTAETVIRLLPPLIMSDAEAQTLITRLNQSLRCFLRGSVA